MLNVTANSTLDGVVMNADVTMPLPGAYVTNVLTIVNGLTLNGRLTLDSGTAYFKDTQSVVGSGEIFFGGSVNSHSTLSVQQISAPAELTIGPDIMVRGVQHAYIEGSASTRIVNQGTIDTSGGDAVDADAGDGGAVMLLSRDGSVYNTGVINSSGGSTGATGSGGNAGEIV